MSSGCWVHVFAREQYRAPVTTYTGPTQEPSYSSGEARSLMVGPHAYLIGYADGRFLHQSLVLPPGARVAHLAATDFHARVRSFKVACGDADPQLPARLRSGNS